jgi:nucleoside-triphosphatase THEP1
MESKRIHIIGGPGSGNPNLVEFLAARLEAH